MTKTIRSIFITYVFLLAATLVQAQVGIGTNNPHSSAQLEVRSNNKGVLLPNISLTGTNDVSTISSPATGLLIYNSNTVNGPNAVTPGFYYFNGTAWVRLIVPADNAANVTGTIAVANGGTGATSAAGAIANLGVIASAEKGANNGVATLGSDGKIPSAQIPAVSFQSANVVANQTAMLGLSSAVVGSIAIRTDVNKNFVLSATPAATLSNWIELATPTSVTSVNGNSGPSVTITPNNLGASTIGNNLFTLANPGAVSFPQFNANNTVSALSASDFRSAIGAGTSSTSGTVTSVGLSLPSILSVSGSPVTSSGTLSASLANQNANLVFAGPASGSAAAPSFRTLVAADIPTLNQNTTGTASNVTGIVLPANGGTGLSSLGSGVATFLGTPSSSNLAAAVTDETGSGALVFGTSPTLTTPNLGAATASSLVSPTITGGTGTTQSLIYKTTTGNGTTGADHIFQVGNNGGTEAMRISNVGKIGIGTNTPTTALHIQNNNSIGSGDPGNNNIPSIYVYNSNNSSLTAHSIVSIRTNTASSGKPYISFDANGHAGYSIGMNNPTDQLIINTDWNFNTGSASKNAVIINETGQSRVIIPTSSGAHTNDWPGGWGGAISTYDISCSGIYYSNLTQRSDRRLKNDIKYLDASIIEKYLNLQPVSYYWNKDKSSDHKLQYGLIAQEVETLFPEMVSIASDSMKTKSVNYQALHALSIKVIQSQQAEIDMLKKKQEELEIRLLKLESKF